MRRLALVFALTLGCGSVQPAVGPAQEALVDGFPSKPYLNQLRPGKDGRCIQNRGPPVFIVKGGGCWAAVEVSLSECALAQKEGGYFVPHEGRCYHPMFDLTPQREPTSSLLPR